MRLILRGFDLISLFLLFGGLALDCSLLCFLVERRQLTLLAQDPQQLDDQREIVMLAANVFDLKAKKVKLATAPELVSSLSTNLVSLSLHDFVIDVHLQLDDLALFCVSLHSIGRGVEELVELTLIDHLTV
jgi:hypothetical protein